jgi:hypothetical protein
VTLSYYPEICVEKPRKNQNLRIVGIWDKIKTGNLQKTIQKYYHLRQFAR